MRRTCLLLGPARVRLHAATLPPLCGHNAADAAVVVQDHVKMWQGKVDAHMDLQTAHERLQGEHEALQKQALLQQKQVRCTFSWPHTQPEASASPMYQPMRTSSMLLLGALCDHYMLLCTSQHALQSMPVAPCALPVLPVPSQCAHLQIADTASARSELLYSAGTQSSSTCVWPKHMHDDFPSCGVFGFASIMFMARGAGWPCTQARQGPSTAAEHKMHRWQLPCVQRVSGRIECADQQGAALCVQIKKLQQELEDARSSIASSAEKESTIRAEVGAAEDSSTCKDVAKWSSSLQSYHASTADALGDCLQSTHFSTDASAWAVHGQSSINSGPAAPLMQPRSAMSVTAATAAQVWHVWVL
jgi:hypothetical protein